MDVELTEKASGLIQAVKEGTESYTLEDIQRDPWNTFVYNQCGFSESSVNSWLNDNSDEIQAVVDFASEWDIDANEWDFSTLEKRASFAIMYLAIQIEDDIEYAKENAA